jgi:hypothetical protein
LILSLLEKKPADRLASAQAVWQALERVKHPIPACPRDPPEAHKGRATTPIAPSVPPKLRSAHRPPDEGKQVAALEAVEAEGRRAAAKRMPSGISKKRRSKGRQGEDELERKVMTLAIVVAIAVFCLVAFLIVRHFLSKRASTESMDRRRFDSQVILVRSTGPPDCRAGTRRLTIRRVVFATQGEEACPRCHAAISCL